MDVAVSAQHRCFCAGTELKLVVYRTPVRAGVSTAFYNNVRRAITPDVCTIAVWSAGTELKLVVYRTPVRAGVSTAFYNNVRRAITPEGEKKLAELRARFRSTQRFGEGANTLETHMNMLRFFVRACGTHCVTHTMLSTEEDSSTPVQLPTAPEEICCTAE